MVRYIIEKHINDYAHGLLILKDDNGQPRKFTTESEALDFLRSLGISTEEIAELYNIKPCVI